MVYKRNQKPADVCVISAIPKLKTSSNSFAEKQRDRTKV